MKLDTHKKMFAHVVCYAVSEVDKKQGIIGYTQSIGTCPVTGKMSNCLYLTLSGEVRLAESQQAANQLP